MVQGRRRDRANIFLDGRFAFSLGLDIAARLQRGRTLSGDEVARLLARDAEAGGLESALALIARRPRSRHEILTYLQRKDLDEASMAAICGRLEGLGYLDDGSFARWWIENRLAHRPRGRVALRHELRGRGVAPDVIEEALADLDEEPYALAIALDLAPRHRHLGRPEFEARVGGFLKRRGFDFHVIRSALNTAWQQRLDPTTGGVVPR